MRILGILAGVWCLALLAACGGGSSSTTTTITLVGASCSPTSILSLQTTQCTASVSGTGSFSSTVLWTASGGGTITAATGLFTAETVPFTTQVTITATSASDSTKSGSTTITVAAAGTVTSVSANCSPSSVQTGQSSTCAATVNGTGSFSTGVTWSASGGTINPISGLFSASSKDAYTITATSQQDSTKTGTATVNVVQGVNNVLPIVVDGGPAGNYVNGAFTTSGTGVQAVTVCVPGTNQCQTIDHILVDTGSVGLRLLAKGAGGQLDLNTVPLPLQQTNGGVTGQCNVFVDGFTWGSVSLATIQMAGEIASTVPNATVAGVPIQVIGDPRVPTVPGSCSSQGMGIDENNLAALGANGVLGVGTFEQDCGSFCVSNTSPPQYYACASGCNPTTQTLAQQVTNPVWALPQDNNGVLVQLPSIPSGGTTTVQGSLIIGIGTQTNNGLGSATVFNTDANPYFTTNYNGQTNSCSYIDSGSNAYFFSPVPANPLLVTCSSKSAGNGFYCPASLLNLTASNSDVNEVPTNPTTGTVAFNVGNATTLFSNTSFAAFSELGGPNMPINGCGSFDWGLPFFYGKPNGVFTGIEQQPVTGTSYVGPFWAY